MSKLVWLTIVLALICGCKEQSTTATESSDKNPNAPLTAQARQLQQLRNKAIAQKAALANVISNKIDYERSHAKTRRLLAMFGGGKLIPTGPKLDELQGKLEVYAESQSLVISKIVLKLSKAKRRKLPKIYTHKTRFRYLTGDIEGQIGVRFVLATIKWAALKRFVRKRLGIHRLILIKTMRIKDGQTHVTAIAPFFYRISLPLHQLTVASVDKLILDVGLTRILNRLKNHDSYGFVKQIEQALVDMRQMIPKVNESLKILSRARYDEQRFRIFGAWAKKFDALRLRTFMKKPSK